MTAPAVSLRTGDDRACRFRRIAGGGIRCALEVTRRCNLACPHCFVARGGAEPTRDEWLQVIGQLGSVGCRKVILTGGEPLLRRDLEDLIAACAGQGALVDLNSNLLALTPGRARALAGAGLSEASVSLYGDEAVHDRFVGCAGAFARTVRGMRALRALGIPVDVHAALGAHNAGRIARLADLCAELGCASLTLFTLLPPAGGWQPGAEVVEEIAMVRRECALPVRTIGVATADLGECVMGESIVGVTAGLMLKPCLLAAERGGGAYDLRHVGMAAALAALRAEVGRGAWQAACCGS